MMSRVLFFLSLAFLIGVGSFCVGYGLRHFEVWPSSKIERLVRISERAIKLGVIDPRNLLTIPPESAARELFAVHDRSRLGSDYRLILGYDAGIGLYRARLFDASLNEIHSWEIFNPGESGNLRRFSPPHGMAILPDGSIVVTHDSDSFMARHDACGSVVWTKKGAYHHSFDRDDDGHLWTWLGERNSHDQNQSIVKIDAQDGNVLKRISVRDDIVRAHPRNQAILNLPSFFGTPPKDAKFVNEGSDLFHANDVEVLKANYAEKFPAFTIGDLLLSFRNLNMVLVVDKDDYRIKWWSHGPWINQHDADFTDTGEISVFNNNVLLSARKSELYEMRSNIYFVNPTTNQYRQLPFQRNSAFFTATMGKQQLVAGGIVHITVPHEGRVLEVDASTGDLILEFNNVYDRHLNSHIANSARVAPSYLKIDFRTLRCSGK